MSHPMTCLNNLQGRSSEIHADTQVHTGLSHLLPEASAGGSDHVGLDHLLESSPHS